MDEVLGHRSGERFGCRIDNQHADRLPGRAAPDVLHLPAQRHLLIATQDSTIMRRIYIGALAVAMTTTLSCARSDLLGVSTPDAITLNNLNSADGAEGLRVGAIRNFKLMTALDESSWFYGDRKSTRLNSSHVSESRRPSSPS